MLKQKCSNIEKFNMRVHPMDVNNYKTIKELADIYSPLFTESALRQMIHKNIDGINVCVFKIGGRVLINIEKFEAWFKERENIKKE